MKEKEIKIFAGVFIVLLLLFFLTKPRHSSVNIDEFVQTILIGVAKEDVASIEVYKQLDPENKAQMLLVRDETDNWRVATKFNAKGSKSKIDGLLDDLIEMTGKVRDDNVGHHEMYEVTDAQGIHLLLKDESGKPLGNLIFGKKGEDSGSGFVRIADREKVYFADKDILSKLSIYSAIDTLTKFKDQSFVDLKAIDQKKEDVFEVAVAKNGTQRYAKRLEREVEEQVDDSTTTTKKEDYWVLVKGNQEVELDKSEVNKMLGDVTSVYASEVVDKIGQSLNDLNKPQTYGLNLRNPRNYLVFKNKEGKQTNIIFGKEYEADKGYYMYVQEDGLIYEVSKYNYDKIVKWADDLPEKVKKED